MTHSADQSREDSFLDLMTRYDEVLAGDTTPPDWDDSLAELDPELATKWQQTKKCLELLNRARESTGFSGPPRPRLAIAEGTFPVREAPKQLGRFHVERELGRGGLGIVYLAHDPKLRRKVALKIPRIDIVAPGDQRRRFVREAEAAARLSHPNIVALHEVGEDGATCYLACEYCPGPTLSRWLRACTSPVSAKQAATITLRLAEAVQHAHSRGVLHRDIKPGNVLLAGILEGDPSESFGNDDRELGPKLTDFGLAKLSDQEGHETRTGAVLGTLAYMSPEQAEGRVAELDARTDVYGLGAILYELLTGTAPYMGRGDADTLRQLLLGELASPRRARPELPRDLESIALKCLANRPSDRYATANDLVADLNRFLAGEQTVARPLAAWERVWKWTKRRPMAAALTAVSIASVISLMLVTTIYGARAERSLSRTRQLLYAADMQAGFEAIDAGHRPTALEKLERYRPAAGSQGLQTFTWHLLDGLVNADQHTLYDHRAPVLALACSPDGRLVASGGRDFVIRVWDRAESCSRGELRGHGEDINTLAFSPDERLLASASDDHTVRVWTLDGSAPVRTLSEFSDQSAYGVAFSTDGATLAVGSEDGKVRLWETVDWTLSKVWTHHTARVNRLSFSADGTRLVSCSHDGTVKVLAVPSGDVISTCTVARDPRHAVDCVAISPDGRRVAAASIADRAVTIVAADTGRKWSVAISDDQSVYNLAFSPDGQVIAGALRSGAVRIWNASTKHVMHNLLGHEAAVRGIAFSVDGRSLLSGGIDGKIKAWNLEAIGHRETYRHTTDAVRAIAFQPGGRLLAYCEASGEVVLVDTRTGLAVFRVHPGDPGPKCFVSFSPDGRLLAYAACEGEELHLLDVNRRQIECRLRPAGGHITAATFIEGGRRILAADDATGLTKWDTANGREVVRVSTGRTDIFSVDPLVRRGLIATVDSLGAELRDCETLETRRILPPFLDKLQGEADVSPDESLLVSGTATGKVVVWDLRSSVQRSDLVGHQSTVEGVAFSPDGTTFATCGSDCAIHLWDVRTLQEVGQLDVRAYCGSASRPIAVSFSPDGSTLSVAGEREDWGMIRFWSYPASGSPWMVNRSTSNDSIYDCLVDDQQESCLELANDLVVDGPSLKDATLRIAPDSSAKFNATTTVGNTRLGELNIRRGARVDTNDELAIGRFAGSWGKMTLDDGAIWRNKHSVQIGDYGQGELLARGGSTVDGKRFLVGYERNSRGDVTLDGADTAWRATGDIVIAGMGRGDVNLLAGSNLRTDGGLVISQQRNSRGSVTASGRGTSIQADGIYVGPRGHGSLLVFDGATVACREMCLTERGGGNGKVTVSGDGSRIVIGEACILGGDRVGSSGSPGELIVGTGAAVDIAGEINIWQSGMLCVEGGALNAGSIRLASTGAIDYRDGEVNSVGDASLDGRLDVSHSQAVTAAAGGTIRIIGYGTRSGEFKSIVAPPGIVVVPEYRDDVLVLAVERVTQP